MNRLTEKSTDYNFYFPKKKVSILDLSNKLGKLEDLEEELGLPLEVVFEALKEGIIVPKVWYPTIRLEKFKIGGEWNFTWQSGCVKLKDYQKTWWLPSDKEWKDE